MHPEPESWSAPHPEERIFWETFDSDHFFDFAERLSAIGTYELGFRPSGTGAGHRAADLILDEMRRLGLHNVRKEAFPVFAWDFSGASLEIPGWEPLPACGFPPTPGSPAEGLTATLVHVGQGTAPEYLGRDLQDKIAFVHFDTTRLPWVDVLAHEAELHGARALVFYYLNGYAQHDSGKALNTHNGEARPTIPILQIAKRDGARLAERLVDDGPMQATIHSDVKADPDGTGYNVVGELPGKRRDRYLIVNGHYDAWFHGYWDNAIGVAAVLVIAKTLVDAGYQPEHTLLFTATDAEEFGAPDTQFDWLTGCFHLLRSHPEWHGRASAAFNIDGLAIKTQEQLAFISAPELLPFLRRTVGTYRAKSFVNSETSVEARVTAWTETLTYAYFGIPPIQPAGALTTAAETIYHTQFDDASIVNQEGAAETAQLYGASLVRFDRQPVLPYDFTERIEYLRTTATAPLCAKAEGEVTLLNEALDQLTARAQEFNRALAATGVERSERPSGNVNDALCAAAAHLVENINYLNPNDPDDALPLHVFYDRDLRALDAALDYLAKNDIGRAITALTNRESGMRGAAYALDISYPVYYRRVIDTCNPGRDDLFWATDRTAALADVWGVLHTLQDKSVREIAEYSAEKATLWTKREQLGELYREAVERLAAVVAEAAIMLPVQEA
jgi:aminopeptidase YwaD